MIFRQLIFEDLASASYLVGDAGAGVAAVIDPHLDIEEYLETARFLGVEIGHVLETHTHADRVSGHGRLAAATGATIHVHRRAGARYPHEPFDDGWSLRLGEAEIRAMHTPGHRPEHTAFVLIDHARGPEPWAVLTGDSLFVADIARPDLAVAADDGARDMFRSLHDGLLRLPPATEVWPGHLGGSLCGGPGMDLKVSSTIAFELAHNPLLAERDLERFVAATTADLPPQPPNLARIVEINRAERPPEPVAPLPMSPHQLAERIAAGALAVDVRSEAQFDDAHIPGAISVPMLRGGFGTRLAWLARAGEPIVAIGRDDQDGRRAARLAASVGLDSVAGYLAGGVTAWREEGRPAERIERMPVTDLPAALAADPDLQVLDVRDEREHRRTRLEDAIHIPYHRLRDGAPGLDLDRPVAVICASGQRAGIAASILAARGARRPIHVTAGGVGTLESAGSPLVAAA